MDKLKEVVNHIHTEGRKSSTSQPLSTRDMTSLDDLTHNFTNEPEITRAFLEKFGQVFVFGKRFQL